MRYTAELVLDAKALLGEGPCWDDYRQGLLWVDIEEQELHFLDVRSGKDHSINTGRYIGAVVPTRDKRVLAALDNGFYSISLDEADIRLVCEVQHASDMRFNDGKCDAVGRFWAGTMALDEREGAGSLYVLDTDGRLRLALSNVSVSNGLAWSLDGKTMYYIDSPTRVVKAFAYDPMHGRIGEARTAVHIPDGEGVPDGMTIDQEGMLWVAQWGGWGVSRFDPQTGARLAFVQVPASQVTSCAFGGPRLNELYITTARLGLSDHELQMQPHAGGVFKVCPGVRGMPENVYQQALGNQKNEEDHREVTDL